MHLLFLDESSTPPKPEQATGKYFTIAGLVVPEGAWHVVAKEFPSIKERYRISGEIKWRYFGNKNNDAKSSLSHLTQDRRDSLRSDPYKLVTSRRSLKIIACVTCAEAAYAMPSVTSQDDIYHLTYKAVTERFQYFLQDATKETGSPQYGISDHRMNLDDERGRVPGGGVASR